MKRFALILAVLACTALSVAPSLAQFQTPNVVAAPNLGKLKPSILTYLPTTVSILKADFPQDYETLRAAIDAISGTKGTERQKMKAGFTVLTSLKQKYADRLKTAPDKDLTRLLGYLAEFHAAVLTKTTTQMCGRFAAQGAKVLAQSGATKTFAEMLDAQSAAYFYAVAQALENPSPSASPTDDDGKALTQALLSHGGTLKDLERISQSDAKDPKLCNSLVGFLRVLSVLDGPSGHRLRADFAKNAVGY